MGNRTKEMMEFTLFSEIEKYIARSVKDITDKFWSARLRTGILFYWLKYPLMGSNFSAIINNLFKEQS